MNPFSLLASEDCSRALNVNAYATPVDEEANTTNNFKKCTIVIAHMGDVNADFKVDIIDVAKVSAAFGSLRANDPYHPRYNQWWHESACPTCPHTANADINATTKPTSQT